MQGRCRLSSKVCVVFPRPRPGSVDSDKEDGQDEEEQEEEGEEEGVWSTGVTPADCLQGPALVPAVPDGAEWVPSRVAPAIGPHPGLS